MVIVVVIVVVVVVYLSIKMLNHNCIIKSNHKFKTITNFSKGMECYYAQSPL